MQFYIVLSQDHTNACEFMTTECTNTECKEEVQKRNLFHHTLFECQYRLKRCEFCAMTYKFNTKNVRLNLITILLKSSILYKLSK